MLLISIFIFIVSLQSLTLNAQHSSDLPHHHNNDSSSFLYLNLKENKHRIGFEVFFWLTNTFVDNYFSPYLPEELFNYKKWMEILSINGESDSFKAIGANLANMYMSVKDEKDDDAILYAKLPFKIYSSILVLTILCLVATIVIPAIGFCIGFYRCCCCCKSSKFDPYDRKADSFLRKFNSFFMFIILTTILLTTITLFFTNQNALSAVSQSADVFNRSMENVKKLKSQIPQFVNKTQHFQVEFDNEINFILKESFDRLAKVPDTIFNKPEDLDQINKLKDEIKRLHEILTSENTKNLFSKYEQFSDRLKTFFKELKNKDAILSLSIETEMKNQLPINEVSSKLKPFSDSIFSMIKSFSEAHQPNQNIQVTSKTPSSDETYEIFNTINNYYKYFYMVLMSICLFILFLFVLYGSGMGGICARRKHKNIKQSCHRGVSANFLMCGVYFYFMFSWIAVLISIILFVPGISVRHLVCKPLIELDNNQIFKNVFKASVNAYESQIPNSKGTDPLQKIEIPKDFNFTLVLNQCDKSEYSDELNSKAGDIIMRLISSKMKPELFLNSFGDLTQIMNQMIEKLQKQFDDVKNELTTSKIEEFKTEFEKISNIPNIENREKEKIDELKKTILDYLVNYKKLVDKLESQLSKASPQLIEKEFKTEIIETFFPKLDSMVFKSIQKILKFISCKSVSNIYKDIIVTGCFEYLDNFNTFWLTLLFTIMLFFILSFFSICQSDLFRKNYPYDQITNESQTEDSKNIFSNQNNRYQTKKHHFMPDTFDNLPIDAFEMENHRPTSNRPLNKSPPPQYRDA